MVDLTVLAAVVFAFGLVSRRLEGTVLTAPIGFVVAGFVLGPAGLGVIQHLSWEVALYALLSLTVIRMLPVAPSLYGTHLRGVSVLFAGWFGPRGLASIVLGLIVVEEAPLLSGRGEIEAVVALTVLLSVLLHGITAAPLSAVYARRVQGMAADAPEKQGTV